MRLEEYFPEMSARLTSRIAAFLAAGDVEAALVLLRKSLTIQEQVLDGHECPPVHPPASVGDKRWDVLISASLLDILGDAWPPPTPLTEPWWPGVEIGAERLKVEAVTPPALAAALIFIRREDLRWPTTR